MATGKDRSLSDAIGTLRDFWRIGKAGVRLKNNAGVLEIKDSGDTAYASLKTASLSLVTGAAVDTIPQSDAAGLLHLVSPESILSDFAYPTAHVVFPRSTTLVSGNFGAPIINAAAFANQYSLLIGTSARVKFTLPFAAGSWAMYFYGFKSNVSADLQIFLDGTSLGTYIGYNATSIFWEQAIGLGTLAAGLHQIDIANNGKQAASGGFNCFCSALVLGIS